MVDVDRRTPAHAAGLRRLSTRASALNSPSTHRIAGIHSFAALASSLSSSLSAAGVDLSPGLTEPELSRTEARFALTFPPDLRALLSRALPSSPGFPNWRSPAALRPLLDLPIAAVSLQIARGSFWPKSWGPRPSDPAAALRHARSSLKRAPLLIPIFHRCYVPSLPPLAGNPVFFVDDDQISLCGLDLADFFSRFLRIRSHPLRSNSLSRAADPILPRNPRWIEFWSDAAACDRKRRSSSSTSDPERFVEIRMVKLPRWVKEYLDEIGSVRKNGGWGENDVSEMVEAAGAASSSPEILDLVVDGQAVLDALLLKADRCSDSLMRAGWSSEEVTDVLGFDFRLENGKVKRAEVKLPAEIRMKIGKLAEAVARS